VLVSGGTNTEVSSLALAVVASGPFEALFWQEKKPIVPAIAVRTKAFTLILGADLNDCFMYKVLMFLLFVLLEPNHAITQILPKEGAVLNYRLVGFSFPANVRAKGYRVEIATGDHSSNDSFEKNIVKFIDSKDTVIIGEVPSFGQQYCWRIVLFLNKNNTRLTKGKIHHFSTGIAAGVDTNKTCLRVTDMAQAYKDAYIFTDGNRALYDMNGRPVWYLPNIDGLVEREGADVRDLKLTPQGTITFLLNDKRAYEINYEGDVLWKGPRNDLQNPDFHYHHELTRMKNGHYMVLATDPVLLRHNLTSHPDSGFLIVTDTTATRESAKFVYQTLPFSSILEYDVEGNLLWSWSTAKYLANSDVYYREPPTRKNKYDVHPNSFYFNGKDSVVYLSIRDISRVIKIKYPSGDVLGEYGDQFGPGKPTLSDSLFYGQHSISCAADGDLYLYNNGDNRGKPTAATIEKLHQPDGQTGLLTKAWEYNCTVEDPASLKHKMYGFTVGGNVEELSDGSLFVSMSAECSKLFIVGVDKKIRFSALPEKWDNFSKKWMMAPQYRASMITSRRDMERLVWYKHDQALK